MSVESTAAAHSVGATVETGGALVAARRLLERAQA